MNGTEYDRILQDLDSAKSLIPINLKEAYLKIEGLTKVLHVQLRTQIIRDRYEGFYKQNENLFKNLVEDIDFVEYYFETEGDEDDAEISELLRRIIRHITSYYYHVREMEESERLSDVRKDISFLAIKSKIFLFLHQTLQIITILGAAIVPFMLNIPEISKLIPTIVSAIVGASAALTGSFKFGEYGINLQLRSDKMQQQLRLYETSRGIYKNLSKGIALDLLLDQMDEIKKEQENFSYFLMLDRGKHKNRNDLSETS